MIQRPWENLGKDVSATGSLIEAMREADVLFNVSIRQGYFIPFDAPHQGKSGDDYKKAEGHYLIVRDDINAALGSCKTKFQPLQNADAFSFFEPLVNDGICKIDTIGTFGVGQKVWILAEITDSRFTVVPGDDITLYIILVNAHDGSTSVMVGIVPIRIWCSNMFSMLNRSDFQIIKFKHTGDPTEKLRDVQEFINEQLSLIEGFTGRLTVLAQTQISYTELDEYFRTVFNIHEKDKASTKANNKIMRLHELFIHGRGNQYENVRGSWYAAYNAVSEYLNYEAGRSAETRLTSLWFGVNNNINHKALELAIFKVAKKKAEVINALQNELP
jgi:phage/plasmid-like protein (TIGR03299 family)